MKELSSSEYEINELPTHHLYCFLQHVSVTPDVFVDLNKFVASAVLVVFNISVASAVFVVLIVFVVSIVFVAPLL